MAWFPLILGAAPDGRRSRAVARVAATRRPRAVDPETGR